MASSDKQLSLTPDTNEIVQDVRTPTGMEVVTGEIGKSGTYVFSGIISQEEYNGDLTREKGLKIYDQMRRGDGTVSAVLAACKLPVLSATWTIQAADDSAEAELQAEYIRQELMGRNIQFNDFMREALTMLDFGYSVAEKVLEFTTFNGKTYIGLSKLPFRKQRSIYSWETEDHEEGITQYVLNGRYSIPRYKLAIFTNQKEGDNYEGISLLRPAYKHWQIKDKLYLIDAIRHERQGLGIIKIMDKPGVVEPNQADVDAAIETARQMRANEEAYLRTNNSIDMEFMDMKANTTTNVMESVMHHDRQISKSVLGQFLELGASGGSGSRALSADHSRLFMLAEESTAKTLANVIQNDIIKFLIDINFSNPLYPKIEHSRIGDEDISELSDALQKLASANIVTPDAELEQAVRDALHMPDLPEAYKEDYDNRPRATAAPSPEAPTAVAPSGKNENLSASDAINQAIKARADIIKAIDAEYDNANH